MQFDSPMKSSKKVIEVQKKEEKWAGKVLNEFRDFKMKHTEKDKMFQLLHEFITEIKSFTVRITKDNDGCDALSC